MTTLVSSIWLAFRAVLWAVILPGFFGFYLPWRYFGLDQISWDSRHPLHLLGLIVLMIGALLLALCIYEFARSGRGTLSPLDPPRALVVRGLYRLVRNPMYLSVTLIVLGETILTRSTGLLIYWALWFAAANLFVILYEEPTLRKQFGDSYEIHAKTVGRWIPRIPPRPPAV